MVNTVWYRKTLIRKSGANAGKEYFKYVSKCGRSFNSLKSAKEFDSSLQNNDDTSGVDDDEAVDATTNMEDMEDTVMESPEDAHLDCPPSPTLEALFNEAVAIDLKTKNPVYVECLNVCDDKDNSACDALVKENGLILLTTAGANHVIKPGDGKIELHNTTSIDYMLGCNLREKRRSLGVGTQRQVKDFIEMVLDRVDENHGYFKEAAPVLRQFLLESSNMYKRQLHTIQWYYSLFDVISRIFGIEIGLILPPDGSKGDGESRVVLFPFDGKSCDGSSPDILFRLLLDRTKIQNRIGDGGTIVAGVSAFVFKGIDESSEVAFSDNDDGSSVGDGSTGTNDTVSPVPKRLKSDSGNGTSDGIGNDELASGGHSASPTLKRNTSLFDSVVNGTFGSGDNLQPAVKPPPNDVAMSGSNSTARTLFSTPNNRPSAKGEEEQSETIKKLVAEIQLLKQQNSANVAQGTGASTNSLSKGELSNNQIIGKKNESTVDTSASSSGGAWGSFESSGNDAILKAASPVKYSRSISRVSVELTDPIQNRLTGEQSCMIILKNLGKDAWWMKADILTSIMETYFKLVHKKNSVASCYVFNETVIKAIVYGNNTIAKKIRQGGSSYPIYKIFCILNFSGKGYSVDTHLTNFENNLKLVFSDAKVPAVISVNALKEGTVNLYNGFFNGTYREGKKKNKSYNNDDELIMDIKAALETTFKNGFGSKTFKQPLNKLLTDWGIKKYLTELGYTSFEDVLDCDKYKIYRNGEFPTWDAIDEDDING